METRHLIDGIVRQTTVLIAQLSTAAGIRAPLSKIADDIFLNLARELEAQGVARKIAADMFGLALRSYQLKINRLTASANAGEQTLWEAILEHLSQVSGATRSALMKQFERNDPGDVASVLKDLADSGFVSRAGRGDHTFYQLARPEAVSAMTEAQDFEALVNRVWLAIYDRQAAPREEILSTLPMAETTANRAVDSLISDGRIAAEIREGIEYLVCRKLTLPVGSAQGWETAVFDHFRAVATAIAAKLTRQGPRSAHGDRLGGTTLTFSIESGHPFEAEVYGLLARIRADLNPIWERVAEYNRQHPIDASERVDVTFYFGQCVVAVSPEKDVF